MDNNSENNSENNVNCNNEYKNKLKRAFKYLLIAIITYCLVRYIPEIMMTEKSMIMISSLVAISYAIIDRIAPHY